MPSVLVEVCVDSVTSAVTAQRAGADRLEVCASLHDGGLTPSAGTIAAVREAVAIPIHVLIRPRGGSFVYRPVEIDTMCRDIGVARSFGANGVVVGALRPDSALDHTVLRTLAAAAAPMPVSCHRAFDCVPDTLEALDTLLELGFAAVLTSGGAPTACEGMTRIRHLVGRAAERLQVTAGGGLREAHIADVVAHTGVSAVHVRCGSPVHTPHERSWPLQLRKPWPDDERAWEETDEERLRAIVRLLSRTLSFPTAP